MKGNPKGKKPRPPKVMPDNWTELDQARAYINKLAREEAARPREEAARRERQRRAWAAVKASWDAKHPDEPMEMP